jgi:hypothetical protein
VAELGEERARAADLDKRLAAQTARGDEFERMASSVAGS